MDERIQNTLTSHLDSQRIALMEKYLFFDGEYRRLWELNLKNKASEDDLIKISNYKLNKDLLVQQIKQIDRMYEEISQNRYNFE